MAMPNEDIVKKIVNAITIQGNAIPEKDRITSLDMFIDQRDRELILTTNHRTQSQFEDIKLQSDIKLAIFYFKASRFPEMVAKCRNMSIDFPEEMLQKYKLI